MNILVTGAASELGGAILEQLLAAGHAVTAYDQRSLAALAQALPAVQIVQGNLADASTLVQALRLAETEAVIHLAAVPPRGNAAADAQLNYQTIVADGLALLAALRQTGVQRLVLASSCAVYGVPTSLPVAEDSITQPVNAFGEAHLAIERALRWSEESFGLRSACLRLFNVAGAGTVPPAATDLHLLPQILRVAAGTAEGVTIYGENYDTPDRTCVRDYVHVCDVASATLLALNALDRASCTYNIGSGTGYSVAEVVEMARQVTGVFISTDGADRRPGDVAAIIANVDKAMLELGWQPRHSELDQIIASMWTGR